MAGWLGSRTSHCPSGRCLHLPGAATAPSTSVSGCCTVNVLVKLLLCFPSCQRATLATTCRYISEAVLQCSMSICRCYNQYLNCSACSRVLAHKQSVLHMTGVNYAMAKKHHCNQESVGL